MVTVVWKLANFTTPGWVSMGTPSCLSMRRERVSHIILHTAVQGNRSQLRLFSIMAIDKHCSAEVNDERWLSKS
jgi:hypothetical protein